MRENEIEDNTMRQSFFESYFLLVVVVETKKFLMPNLVCPQTSSFMYIKKLVRPMLQNINREKKNRMNQKQSQKQTGEDRK